MLSIEECGIIIIHVLYCGKADILEEYSRCLLSAMNYTTITMKHLDSMYEAYTFPGPFPVSPAPWCELLFWNPLN